MKKLLLLTLILLSSTAISETVTTNNLLSNSTFGTGTTYSDTGWTITGYDSSHNYTSLGNGNDPGGAVAAGNNTNIEQTVSSIKTAAGMTVNEVRKGWSSTLSTDIWYWNSYDNTTTLKQTITDNDGNVTVQQRVITDTGCGSINCGQYTNYTDTHIQGTSTKDDFSIKVGVSNSNNRTGHYGPDIDDIQLKITYTDVPPIEEDTQEELDEITEEIDEVVEDIEDTIDWEETWTFEEEYAWEEDFYFEEDFNTIWEEFDTVWEEYEMEFDDDIYFEMEEEFVEFEDVGMPEFEEFETVMMPEDTFEDMYMEEFEEFEEFEDAWEMEPEMTEMDTFFNEMTEDDWQEFEEMSEDEFTDFIEEEFPEEFAEMQEEMEMEEAPVEEEMVFEEEEVAMTEEMEEPTEEVMEEPEEMTEEPEEMTEDEPTETEVANEESNEEANEEATDDVETESESEESSQEIVENESEPDAKTDQPSGKISTAKLKEEKIKTKSIARIDVAKIKEIIVEEVKVDLFSNQEILQEYSQVSFYQPEQIYTDVDTSFFDQINMIEYNKEIYQNVRLASYMDNDPVEVHRKNMERINMEKQQLLIELQQLRNQ